MLKQLNATITQSGLTDENSYTLATSGNTILTSILVGASDLGYTTFNNSSTQFMCGVGSNNDIAFPIPSVLNPVFMLDNTLKIQTVYPSTTVINVIVNYIDGAENSPLFNDELFAYSTLTTTTIGNNAILTNSDVFNYNVKSIYVFDASGAENISLLFESDVFTSPISITDNNTGNSFYQLLPAPNFLLKPNNILYLSKDTTNEVNVYVSYTKVIQ